MSAMWREETDDSDEPAPEASELQHSEARAHAEHAPASALTAYAAPLVAIEATETAAWEVGEPRHVLRASKTVARPRISVVIPTFRRLELLERCLLALLAQAFDPTDYEILVSDDARCPATRQLVERLALQTGETGPSIHYVSVTNGHGPAAARNAAWRAARGDLIAFTDDDCVPAPGWLRAGVDALTEGMAGATGRLVLPLGSNPTDYEVNAAQLAGAQFVTANCFYRRDALQRVGGFDERFTAAWREDTDLYFRLLDAGQPLTVATGALVTHPIRPAPWGVSLRQQRKSQFNALLYKKHPALYRARVQASPPWQYYALIALALASLAAVTLGQPWLAAALAVGWASLTARFCVRRLRGTSHALSHVLEMSVTSALIPFLAVFWRLYGAVKYRVWFL